MAIFRVRRVASEEVADLDAFVVIVSDGESGSGRWLEFQRALSFDEQVVALGMDTYCLVSGTGATHYGGVESWRVTDGELRLRLAKGAASELGLPEDLRLPLELDRVAIDTLRQGLQRVFGSVENGD